MALSDEDVREILRIIDESDLDELRVETRGFKLHVRRGGAPAEPAPREGRVGEGRRPDRGDRGADDLQTIKAPMLGTFYAADGPGQEPFVAVGSQVEPDTVVGIIEVMKMMNSVRSGLSGTVVEICTENAELVEEGTPLFRVETA